ncbi:iron-sulfur cluster biosynthesis family protein [Jeotgalibaca ciconiae]|nr:iron-sulfur cluster biosynthesis family protein [Jeotgalibaca ciconiae]HJB23391.1 iron-sulfur cluster biosynthesis family protein [Candidatus Jeotgalibaca pullicola]
MKFTFTNQAMEELKKRQANHSLSLFYYTDAADCGCPSSGIFALRVNDEDEKEYDSILETNLGNVKAQKWALVYLDENNVLDYKESQGTFILKSERGYLNMNVPLENKSKVH